MPDGVAFETSSFPVVVIGAGPVGMAAAAHLILRGIRPLVLEAGPAVGHSVRAWHHVRMFSPWGYNIDRAANTLLTAAGWSAPAPNEFPTGGDLAERYLAPLAVVPSLRDNVLCNARVLGVARVDHDRLRAGLRAAAPFLLQIVGSSGAVRALQAAAVIDCSGTWTKPNPAGAHGLPALGEMSCSSHIAYGMPDICGNASADYAGRTTMVVGSGHSAMNAILGLLDLAKQVEGTRIIWALRRPPKDVSFRGNDVLDERRALSQRVQSVLDSPFVNVLAPFFIDSISRHFDAALRIEGRQSDRRLIVQANRMIVATGFRPDYSYLRELRLDLDPIMEAPRELAPAIDPLLYSCCSVPAHGEAVLRHPEEGFYVAGMKSYGRTPNFLLSMGYEQVRSIAAAFAGDHAAAQEQRLMAGASAGCSCNPLDANSGGSCCGSEDGGSGGACAGQLTTAGATSVAVASCCG